jgi:hypothetical protein
MSSEREGGILREHGSEVGYALVIGSRSFE